jgi:hypothetical protein
MSLRIGLAKLSLSQLEVGEQINHGKKRTDEDFLSSYYYQHYKWFATSNTIFLFDVKQTFYSFSERKG